MHAHDLAAGKAIIGNWPARLAAFWSYHEQVLPARSGSWRRSAFGEAWPST